MAIFDSFWPKWQIFEFFKSTLETFYYTPKALSNCKVSEKSIERMSRYCVTFAHTTSIQFHQIYIPNEIWIWWQFPFIITYFSAATWAMMLWDSSYISLSLILTYQANHNGDLSPKLRFCRTEHPQHTTKNTAYVHLFNFIKSNIPNEICIRWQFPFIITYCSAATWAMMLWDSSYISLSLWS